MTSRMSTEEKAEALARKLSEAAIDAYNSVDDQYIAPMLQAAADELLPFASALVRLAEAAEAYVECGQFKLLLQRGRGTDAAVKAEKLARSALREYEKLEGR